MFQRPAAMKLLHSILLSYACIASANLRAQSPAKSEVLVAAAASLKDVLEELGPLYEKQNAGSKVTFQFAASGALQQQIEQGAPVDVFISAAQKQIDALNEKNLLSKDSVQLLCRNTLVLIVPKDQKSPQSLDELKQPTYKKIAIGEKQTVPAGQYAEEWLDKSSLTSALKDKLVPASNVRQVLTFVETGNAAAGFVYATDAQSSDKVTVALRADAKMHQPIVYPMAVVSKSKNPAAAKSFMSFMKSADAVKVLEKRGFIL